ncbi:MAG: flavin monoamine oxidase family protein [Xenococcaceae cyanobacterium]
MSKSPLIRILRKAYRIAQISRKNKISTTEVIEILKQKTSRRRLLQGGLGFATAIAASSWRQQDNWVLAKSKTPSVLIVGAGIAGLTAAYRLQKAGVAVDIVEARKRIGGRIYSLPRAAGTSITVELGGEFIDTNHVSIQKLAQELGLTVVDIKTIEEEFIEDTCFFNGNKIPLEKLVNDFAPVAQQISKDLEAIADFESYKTAIPAATALDSKSISEYLAGIPNTTETIRQLLEVAYTTQYGLEAQEQSCLNLIYLIGSQSGKFDIYGESDEHYTIEGGNAQIIGKLGALLQDLVKTETVLESIKTLSDGRYLVSLSSDGKTLDRKYERVLLTLPFSMLRQVDLKIDLPPAKKLAIDTIGYGTNSKLITSYQEKIWRDRYNSTANVFTDLGFQNTWESSLSRFAKEESLITNFTGGRQGISLATKTPEFHDRNFLAQIELVFPDISKVRKSDRKPIIAHWHDEEYSRGSYTCYKVGQWTQMYGVEGERVGNLFFAGEHCSQEFQGYMEGGCETGEAAALAILSDLGLKAQTNK